MQSGRAFERFIHAAYDAKTPHNSALHIMRNMPEAHRKTVIEALREELSLPLRFDEMK